MGTTRIITDHWPVVVHVSDGNPTDAEVDAYIREATDLLLRGDAHAVVMDASTVTQASPYSRARKKAWLAEHDALLRKHCVATAVVLKSPVLRFITSTLMLVRPFPTPYRIFDSVEEAMAWARSHVEQGVEREGVGG